MHRRNACCSVSLAFLITLASPAARSRADAVADVVITEIMYNPASGDKREDFIELYNRGSVSYNLEGWRFEDGVSFTFPSVNLGPGKYLVVCGDQSRVRQIYGITNTVGNWSSTTSLDRGGERIRLLDQNDVEVEDFTYDDRNPWPILADGYGHSLERRNPGTDNDNLNSLSGGALDDYIIDPISIMDYLFNGGARPNSPFPDAGLDPTPDGLPGC